MKNLLQPQFGIVACILHVIFCAYLRMPCPELRRSLGGASKHEKCSCEWSPRVAWLCGNPVAWAKVPAQHHHHCSCLWLISDLCRFKEHTGKSLEALEQETARKAELQHQHRAQVNTFSWLLVPCAFKSLALSLWSLFGLPLHALLRGLVTSRFQTVPGEHLIGLLTTH